MARCSGRPLYSGVTIVCEKPLSMTSRHSKGSVGRLGGAGEAIVSPNSG